MIFINPNPSIPTVPFRPDLADILSSAPNQPIALFPVRLETRYFALPTGGFELRVRVYPDKVHVDTHEEELTDQELIWGKHFWDQTWRAINDDTAKKSAWQQLAERFGAQRAGWVSWVLTPLNPLDAPKTAIAADVPLSPAINFPTPATRKESWTRAPQARALPTRWYVLGYVGGQLTQRVAGNIIPDSLATGPDPNDLLDDKTPPNPEQPAIDNGMKWMVDFAEAERVGMAIRVKLTTDQAFQGFDILMVVGTNTKKSAADSTQEIVELLNAHHYTDGLAFLLNGTPSNNTTDAPSGFSTLDPGQQESYSAERLGAGVTAGDGSNADVLAAALGLSGANARAVSNLANGTATEQRDAMHMNRALWAGTLGYYLSNLLGVSQVAETTLVPADFAWARKHFIDFVRASGPLPALRIGKQPYGVLPVTSLALWKPKTGQEAALSRDNVLNQFLLKARELWRNNLSQIPRVGRGGSADSDLADILAMDGLSSSYAIRPLLGNLYLQFLWTTLFADNTSTWFAQQRAFTTPVLPALGLPTWNPRIANAAYTGQVMKLGGPTVQAGTSADQAPLQPNYIDLLLNAPNVDTIRQETFPDPKPRSLLYSLLRVSMLQEYWGATAALVQTDPLAFGAGWLLTREQEVPSLGTASPVVWETLSRPIPGVTTDPASTFLHALRAPAPAAIAPRVTPLLEFRDSLAYLKTLSTGRLKRAFAGTLDLCSHRIDAWFTSVATKRLADIRTTQSSTLVGGYGWVMNLKPAASPAVEITPAGETGTVLRPANNPGFTHTPSLAQASTAAVLRSGHLTHANLQVGFPLAVDLSSERVRLANWLLDGVRQGQPVGALLGYRFERRLHDAHLDMFIPYFREVAPLVANKLQQTTAGVPAQPVESIAANNVVDGLTLQRLWKVILRSIFPVNMLQQLFGLSAKPLSPQAQAALPGVAGSLLNELDTLDANVDAVSDALLAESVHHAVQGNPLRTAATLDSIASGEAPPPELDVVTTPRTGLGLTYRVVTLFGGSVALPVKWVAPPLAQRMSAEPYLSVWAARLLGDPTAVRCSVERVDADTGAVVESREIRLSELKLGPLDLIYANEGSRDAAPSEIEQRIIYFAARKAPPIPTGAILRLNPTRQPTFAATDVSFQEFTEVIRTARRLITAVRGVDASDLNTPGANQSAAVDLVELTLRADRAESAIRSAQTVLQGRLNTPTTTLLDTLRDAIFACAVYGIPGAIPFSTFGDLPTDRAMLLAQGASVIKEIIQRAAELTALKNSFNAATATPDEARDQQFARLRVVFGKNFVVLPRFTAANALEIEKALADNAKIQDNDSLAAATWFQRASRVRDGISRLDASLRYAESLETGEKLSLRVAQLPYQADDRWIALPIKPGGSLSTSRFSLVVQSLSTIDVKAPMTGVLIDEWVEVVPSSKETTGMVFQYDQPDATPPQSILLAVPPDPNQPWNLWQLQQVLLETLDMARIRAVDPDTLDEVGHYLPGLFFATNVAGDTISTDFTNLKF